LDPNKILKSISEIENMAGGPSFDLNQGQEIKINIRVNEKIAPAMFKADPFLPGGYIANSLTIRAMRENIFVLGESIDELSDLYICHCGKEMDIQFWKLCPYCGSKIDH
jgi:hypothetical protein